MSNSTLIPLSSQALRIAFDVGKRDLDYYTEIAVLQGHQAEKGHFRNHPKDIREHLLALKEKAKNHGYPNLLIVCEPTGIYHRQLFRICDLLGLETSLVSGEATHRGKSLARNTRNKTDQFDPVVIHKVSQIAPPVKRRNTTEMYDALKEWGRVEAEAKKRCKRIRTEIKDYFYRLFPTLEMGPDFLNHPNGIALMKAFKCNPYRILQMSEGVFRMMYTLYANQPRKATLIKIWEAAQEMMESIVSPMVAEVYEEKICALYNDLATELKRADLAMEKMLEISKSLRNMGEMIPTSNEVVFTEEWIAKIQAESGPLSDFASRLQFEKYAGMNLCENRSGIRIGQVSMDKKGSSRLRFMFMELAFKLVREKFCYGKVHIANKERGMTGTKSIASVARKLLKAYWGLAKNGQQFNMNRLHLSVSDFRNWEAESMVG